MKNTEKNRLKKVKTLDGFRITAYNKECEKR